MTDKYADYANEAGRADLMIDTDFNGYLSPTNVGCCQSSFSLSLSWSLSDVYFKVTTMVITVLHILIYVCMYVCASLLVVAFFVVNVIL